MLSNTTRLERAERAAQAAREREIAVMVARFAAMTDAELAEIAAPYLSEYEAEHGPLAPRDFAPLFAGLDTPATNALLDALSYPDLLAWRKHDQMKGIGGYAPLSSASAPPADTGPPPPPWHRQNEEPPQ